MGLDMYLYCNSRILTQKVHETEPYGEYVTDWYRKAGICMYWRKTNSVHKWFVDHVQNGVDDCGYYDVDWEQLNELRKTCHKVLDNHALASELLPPTNGFFFGSDKIDDWYWDDIKRTADELDAMFGMMVDEPHPEFYTYKVMPEEPDWYLRFTYHSSW